MPRYELDTGPQRRFYEVELDERRVFLHWGTVGMRGSYKTISLETEADARLEFARRCEVLTKQRGYRLVEEDLVPEVDVSQRLTKQLPLGDSPRFLFSKGRLFGWVEARGDKVISVQGRRAEEDQLKPTEHPCGSEAQAIERRDALIAKFVAQGYELETFGVNEEPLLPTHKQPRRSKPTLADVEALEQQVIEDPADEAAWSVLEDRLLEVEDPRGRLLRLQRSYRSESEEQVRSEFLPLLLGPKHVSIEREISQSVWRGGYLVECRFQTGSRAMLEAFLASPATRLLATLELRTSSPSRSLELVTRLGQIGPPALRTLRIFTDVVSTPLTFDVAALASIPLHALASLTDSFVLRNIAALPALQTLQVYESLRSLRTLFTGTAASLETLVLEGLDDPDHWAPEPDLERTPWITSLCKALEPLQRFAPALQRLSLGNHYDETLDAVRELLGDRISL